MLTESIISIFNMKPKFNQSRLLKYSLEPQLLYASELATKLRRSEWYVYQMKKAGFEMPGGTATLSEAREWLSNTPVVFAF